MAYYDEDMVGWWTDPWRTTTTTSWDEFVPTWLDTYPWYDYAYWPMSTGQELEASRRPWYTNPNYFGTGVTEEVTQYGDQGGGLSGFLSSIGQGARGLLSALGLGGTSLTDIIKLLATGATVYGLLGGRKDKQRTETTTRQDQATPSPYAMPVISELLGGPLQQLAYSRILDPMTPGAMGLYNYLAGKTSPVGTILNYPQLVQEALQRGREALTWDPDAASRIARTAAETLGPWAGSYGKLSAIAADALAKYNYDLSRARAQYALSEAPTLMQSMTAAPSTYSGLMRLLQSPVEAEQEALSAYSANIVRPLLGLPEQRSTTETRKIKTPTDTYGLAQLGASVLASLYK